MIRCLDDTAPPGDWIATADGLIPVDDESLALVAHHSMLLAMTPEHAEALLDQAEVQAKVQAAVASA